MFKPLEGNQLDQQAWQQSLHWWNCFFVTSLVLIIDLQLNVVLLVKLVHSGLQTCLSLRQPSSIDQRDPISTSPCPPRSSEDIGVSPATIRTPTPMSPAGLISSWLCQGAVAPLKTRSGVSVALVPLEGGGGGVDTQLNYWSNIVS